MCTFSVCFQNAFVSCYCLATLKNEIKLDHKSWQKMSSKSYELRVQYKPLFTQYDTELRPTQCTVMSFKDCLSAGIRWCSQPLNCALPLLGYGLQWALELSDTCYQSNLHLPHKTPGGCLLRAISPLNFPKLVVKWGGPRTETELLFQLKSCRLILDV